MGPTITALSQFFESDQALRSAQRQLDNATRDVRAQAAKTDQVQTDLVAAEKKFIEFAAKAANLDQELQILDAKINMLRERQTNATNPKEYQALLVDINTQKLDRDKKGDEALAAMDASEKQKVVHTDLVARLGVDKGKLEKMSGEIDQKVQDLTSQIASLKGPRDESAGKLTPKIVAIYDRVAARYEGDAMSAIERYDDEADEYACSACGISLVVDIYNRLHRKDELVSCPKCARILYIPEDLPSHAKPEVVTTKKKSASTKPRKAVVKKIFTGPSMSGAHLELHRLLSKAQNESVRNASAAGNKPVEFEIFLDGKLFGEYKGQTVENYRRAAIYFLHEAGINKTIDVYLKGEGPRPTPPPGAVPVEAPVDASVETPAQSPVEVASDQPAEVPIEASVEETATSEQVAPEKTPGI